MRMTGPDDEEEELRRDLSKSAGDGTYKGPVQDELSTAQGRGKPEVPGREVRRAAGSG